MQFTYYSPLSVAQCMAAVNERIQARGGSARQDFDGWVEKSGAFRMGGWSNAAGVRWRSYVRGKAARKNGVTTITGHVPGGTGWIPAVIALAAAFMVGLALAFNGGALPAILVWGAGVGLAIKFWGDENSHRALLGELQRATRGKTTLPKKGERAATASVKPARKRSTTGRRTKTTARSKTGTAARRTTPAKTTTAKKTTRTARRTTTTSRAA